MNNFDPDKIRIASPCSVPWESMRGDDRSRRCDLCKLEVHNLSAMTPHEIASLVEKANGGRICARLYRRFDGTVITRDCPTGLRAARKRIATFAGAALTAILGLFSVSFGQTVNEKKKESGVVSFSAIQTPDARESVRGVVTDAAGAVLPDAVVTLTDVATKNRRTTVTDEAGAYQFVDVGPGAFTVAVEMRNFKKLTTSKFNIAKGYVANVDVALAPGAVTVTIGILGVDVAPISTSGGVTTLKGDLLDQ